MNAARREAEVGAVRRRLAAEELARPDGRRALVRGLALVLALVATGAFALVDGAAWAWALHWVAATLVLCTLPAVYHEGTHGSLAPSRFANEAAATVAAALHGVPFETWRQFHLAHHAHAGTEEDSEVYPERWTKRTLLAFPLQQWLFLLRLWGWTLGSVRGRGPRWVRTRRQVAAVRRSAAAALLVLAALAAAVVAVPPLASLLLLPLCLSMMLSSLTLVPEHFPAHGVPPSAPDQLDRTASFRSNAVLRFVMWNSNLHAAHHFAPAVPAHRLPAVDTLIAGLQESGWRHRGYCHWYVEQLRALPWTNADDVPLTSDRSK